MYSAARSPPKTAFVDAQVTRLMFAFLATAPDHSTSKMASTSSLFRFGALQLAMVGIVTVGAFAGRPKMLLKSVTSAVLMLLSDTIAMVSPLPSIPAFHRGCTL